MLSTEIEYYEEIWNIKKMRVFQNIVDIFKMNSIDFIFFFCFYIYGSFDF